MMLVIQALVYKVQSNLSSVCCGRELFWNICLKRVMPILVLLLFEFSPIFLSHLKLSDD